MEEAPEDRAVTHSHLSEDASLRSMRVEAMRRLRHAYENAYRLGNLSLRVINSEVSDPNNPISRDEYVYELLTVARWMANFAIELGVISVQDHHDIRRDFFFRHPELYDKEWHPKKNRRPISGRSPSNDSSGQ